MSKSQRKKQELEKAKNPQPEEPKVEEIVEVKPKKTKKEIAKLVLNIVAKVLLGIFSAILIFFIIADIVYLVKQSRGDKVPMFLGYANLKIETGSMSPTINAGDLIVIHAQGEYNKGDVITFETEDGKTVTHRIIEVYEKSLIRERCYRTKGDYVGNSPDQIATDYDNYIKDEQIYGRVVMMVRNGGTILEFFKTPVGMFVFLGLGILILYLPSIIKFIVVKIKKERLKAQIKALEENKEEKVEISEKEIKVKEPKKEVKPKEKKEVKEPKKQSKGKAKQTKADK
ncbi:MAG: signal peptidase I [Clostridia bacterium]|nr:signal peptidase I [Clostridia bacterium]